MNFISIPTKNLPYKKMSGYLKSQKINPDLIAVSISDDRLRYVPIEWKNHLYFGHKVVKIILSKMDNLFIFVGYSNDDKTIIYNNHFSEIVLNQEIIPKTDQIIVSEKDSTTINKTKIGRINIILDKIGQFGITSLTDKEKKELKELSKK
jgi:hypothetical protein